MPNLPYPVVDADGHVHERDADIREYLPEPYASMAWVKTHPFFPTLDGWPRAITSPGVRQRPPLLRP